MTATEPKIVIVGAGSTVFTPGLLLDLVRHPVLRDAHVGLVDIDPDAVETMTAFARRLARDRGVGLHVDGHTDRREMLAGADVVTTTIAVGGADAWKADLDIPHRHGVRQTVGDTVGPGGVLRALRHVPALLDIARDVQDLAPQAWLVNYTNPLTANVRALTRETGVRTVGLCHGTMHTRTVLCRDLGLDPDRADFTFAGINHLCWLLSLTVDGADAYPALREAVRSAAADSARPGEGVHQPVAATLLHAYGAYPAPGDRHTAEFFAWFLGGPADRDVPASLREGTAMTMHYINEKSDAWDQLRAQAAGTAPLDPTLGDHGREAERLVAIAAALVTGEAVTELAVNVPNGSALPDLPPEAVVEVPADIDADGVHPRTVGPLPSGVADVLRRRISQQELTVDAAVRQDRALALQALLGDPLVPDVGTAEAILADALTAHAGLLPHRWSDDGKR